jgi:hypothetical protein
MPDGCSATFRRPSRTSGSPIVRSASRGDHPARRSSRRPLPPTPRHGQYPMRGSSEPSRPRRCVPLISVTALRISAADTCSSRARPLRRTARELLRAFETAGRSDDERSVQDCAPVGQGQQMPSTGNHGEVRVVEPFVVPPPMLGAHPVRIAIPEPPRRSDSFDPERRSTRPGNDVGRHANCTLTSALAHHQCQPLHDPRS